MFEQVTIKKDKVSKVVKNNLFQSEDCTFGSYRKRDYSGKEEAATPAEEEYSELDGKNQNDSRNVELFD